MEKRFFVVCSFSLSSFAAIQTSRYLWLTVFSSFLVLSTLSFSSVSIYFDLDEKQTKSCASVLCGFLRESLGVCDFFALKINGIKILSFHKNTSPDLFHL